MNMQQPIINNNQKINSSNNLQQLNINNTVFQTMENRIGTNLPNSKKQMLSSPKNTQTHRAQIQ